MNEPCVDTSVIIRLVTGDDPEKQEAAAKLFEDVEQNKLSVFAPDTVIADAVFVLAGRRTYNVARPTIGAALTRLVRLPSFKVKHRRTVLRALDLYATSATLDFGDAMILSSMEQQQSRRLYSYDTDFDRLPGIERKEPDS